jgi:glycerol kinase
MTSKTNREHLVRAALESIAFQIVDVLKAMDVPPSQLEVDGGVAQNNFLTQFLADVAEMTVVRHRMAEATARGAAWLAGLATEFWPSISSLPLDARGETRTFVPAATQAEHAAGYARWRRAVERARGWEEVN